MRHQKEGVQDDSTLPFWVVDGRHTGKGGAGIWEREEFTYGHAEAAGVPVGHPGGKLPSAPGVWTSRRYLGWNYMGHQLWPWRSAGKNAQGVGICPVSSPDNPTRHGHITYSRQ